jgi:uncharacterized protein (DUF433 family)
MSQTALKPVQPEKPLTPEALEGDLIQPGHPLFGIVWVNRERMGGEPLFAGTRVPIKTLFEYLEGGDPLDEFMEDFEGVTREQALAVLKLAQEGLLSQYKLR